MALIQAHRRKIPYTHSFPDVTLLFTPNAKGDVVCDVKDASSVERLLQTPTGFRVYGEPAAEPLSALLTTKAAKVAEVDPLAPVIPAAGVAILPVEAAESPYVLKDEEAGTVLDLRTLSDEELKAFSGANGIKLHHAAKGDTIRNKIVAFLQTEE